MNQKGEHDLMSSLKRNVRFSLAATLDDISTAA